MTTTNQRIPQWARIGKSVKKAMTAEEAIKMGGLDYTVRVTEESVSTTVNGKTLTIDNKFMTYAEFGNGVLKPLGVVGNRYTPIQNLESFDLLNNIVDESGANFQSAGIFGNGERCWINMKMPETMEVGGGVDAIETYLTCMNSHDGSSAFRIHVTFLRLICTNGMTGFTKGSQITLRHTVNASLKVHEARTALGLVFAQQEEFEKQVEQLLSMKMTDNDYKKFVQELVPDSKKDDSQRKQNSVERVRSELMGLWKAPTQQNVKNTGWAAFNAVAEYADWFKPIRGSGEDKEALRAERKMLGDSRLKTRAYELLSV